MAFSDLGLSERVLEAVTQSGYTEPTPIQAQAIPEVLAKRDVIGIAQTGTGKTASFVLPMLTRLESGRARARMPRTLIVEPTRELAAQVEQNFDKYGVNHKLTVALLIGGVSFDEQEKKLDRGADVLIATPGRLLDHFGRGKLLLTGVEILVIDEADRMLDMGFIPDIERICSLVPARRQTLFFSATMAPEISRLTEQFLRDPVRIETSRPASAAENVKQWVVATSATPKDKRAVLRDQIRGAEGLSNAIVFCNRKRDVATLHNSLKRHGFTAGALHGDMDQHQRMAMLESFRSGETPILVASDVAARGLDIPKVSHVFNYDLPVNADDYVHRIGRTGRAGRSGVAIALCTPADKQALDRIEKLIGTSIEKQNADAFSGSDDSEQDSAPRRSRRSRKGKSSDRQPAKEEPRQEAKKPDHASVKSADVEEGKQSGEKPAPRKNRKNEPERELAATAFGNEDFVPAFMLRQTRFARS
ncbi:DEAD/DEAH box helicase [Tepidamorphus sp. 3E244]|uniref:DEAD/DEAH box helicase n=1 Tax=Tepidamorphus sp. 3E244 TaxID=3385498 RepID=UPI0038FC8BA7